MQRVSVAGISGSGKTTFGRALAERLGVAYVELDALHHGRNWTEATAEELRARVEAAIGAAPDGWVIDGNYRSKLDDVVLAQADTLVWLELPLRVSLMRATRRSLRRIQMSEDLWHGNRESFRGLLGVRYGLLSWAIQSHRKHKRQIPDAAAHYPHLRLVHLRTQREVDAFLAQASVSPSQ
jgi:adenylate kinase family enzyme